MSDGMYIDIDSTELLEAYARLKQIPLAKVVRNAAKDFVQAAHKNTPLSELTGAKYYRAELGNRRWWIPIGWLNGRRVHNKSGRAHLKKWLKRGWSKATWIGVMRALGMSHGGVRSDLQEAAQKSSVIMRDNPVQTQSEIMDEVRFDKWCKGADTTSDEIRAKGFELAAKRISSDWEKEVRRQWR